VSQPRSLLERGTRDRRVDPWGVTPEEVGALTGDPEVSAHPREGGIEAAVRYAEADEWYAVKVRPIEPDNTGDLSPSELREMHERIARRLTTA
jgi:hypothetical protein